MEPALVHVEILGPRVGLDAWLATLQRAGSCHLVDALEGLEGEPGIGRPLPREEEQRAADLWAPALLALRSLSPLLPAAPAGAEPAAWSLPPGAVDEASLAAEAERVAGLALGLRRAAEALHRARAEAERLAAADPAATSPSDPAARARREAERRAAREAEERRRDELTQRLAREGPQARRALDALEDAEARRGVQRLLAASGHVVAARAYLAPEHLSDLRERLARAHGGTVLVRPLAPRPDAPGPVESVPAAPLSGLAGWRPARIGTRPASSLLALPCALGAAWAAGDAATGLLLLLGGAWLARGAGPGTPRRESGLLAQGLGLVSLLAGLLAGRAGGGLGAEALGTGWGVAPGLVPAPGAAAVTAVLAVVAAAALALAAVALGAAARRRARRERLRAQAAEGVLRPAGVLGLLALALAARHTGAAWAAAAYGALTLVLALPAERSRLLLDLAGGAGVALLCLAYAAGLPALGRPEWGLAGLALSALLPAALVLEVARAAMGLAHPVVLGRAAAAPAFSAFARHGRTAGEEAR